MSQLLSRLLLGLPHQNSSPGYDPEILSITDDSRRVRPGSLFVAVRGAVQDGHIYIDKALEAGAAAILCEELPSSPSSQHCYITVADSREALGRLASAWYDHPSRDLSVVGVTGTNGKTTIATLLYRLFRSAGYSVGLLSTVCNYIDDEVIPSTHTTPGALELQALLDRMRQSGCSHVFMEVSSHAAEQRRIAGVDFRGGVFSNLTRDHLDYHHSVLNYLNAKKRFFDGLSASAFALTNLDEKSGMVMLQNTQAHKYTYALHSMADYKGSILERYPNAMLLQVNGQEVTTRLIGEFNAYNFLAVYGAACLLGLPSQETLVLLSRLGSVDGRFETFTSSARGYTAVVDYAHTPDALVNVLQTCRSLIGHQHRLVCVVGCGGDRDRGKRPIMAAEAARLADRVILTSDNPRSEDPVAIIQEMRGGIPPEAAARVLSILDRSEAIRTACMLAERGDMILVAGKGHETYQEIKGVKHPFDDREVVRSFIEAEGAALS